MKFKCSVINFFMEVEFALVNFLSISFCLAESWSLLLSTSDFIFLQPGRMKNLNFPQVLLSKVDWVNLALNYQLEFLLRNSLRLLFGIDRDI